MRLASFPRLSALRPGLGTLGHAPLNPHLRCHPAPVALRAPGLRPQPRSMVLGRHHTHSVGPRPSCARRRRGPRMPPPTTQHSHPPGLPFVWPPPPAAPDAGARHPGAGLRARAPRWRAPRFPGPPPRVAPLPMTVPLTGPPPGRMIGRMLGQMPWVRRPAD